MEIISTSKELTKEQLYLMTKSPSIKSVKDIEDGTELTVKASLVYQDVNSKGEESEILSIMGENNEVWACQSETFKRSFNDLVEIMGAEGFTLKKLSGVTNAGRPYVNCDLVVG